MHQDTYTYRSETPRLSRGWTLVALGCLSWALVLSVVSAVHFITADPVERQIGHANQAIAQMEDERQDMRAKSSEIIANLKAMLPDADQSENRRISELVQRAESVRRALAR